MPIPIDYETLRIIWWALLGILLIGFAIMDGFDLGTAILLPFMGRTDLERRMLINSVGPVWEGNQVWFILGGGAAFAAWPPLYAISFSGFYLAMLLVLLALILRPVAIKFRSKIDDDTWRTVCDIALFISGIVPALIFGVAFGNLLLGVPFHLDDELRAHYTGSFFGLLNPFALLCGRSPAQAPVPAPDDPGGHQYRARRPAGDTSGYQIAAVRAWAAGRPAWCFV